MISRLAWWRSGYARLAALAATAGLVAYIVADLVPFADPVPAAITAVISVRVAFHQAAKETSFQVLGALFGATFALALVQLIGSGPIVIFLLVIASFTIARLMKIAAKSEMPFIAANISVTSIIVVGAHFDTEGAIERFAGVVIGSIAALIASYAASPTRDTVRLIEDSASLQRDLSHLLADVAEGLRTKPDAGVARAWREQATELRNRSLGLEATFEELRTHRSWSPRIDAEELQALEATVDANRVMSVRVLSITADLTDAMGAKGAGLPDAALSPLADLISLAADNMAADDPTTSIGVTAASEAVRVADQTAQIALIGGIVSHVNRITRVSAEAAESAHDDTDDAHALEDGPDAEHPDEPEQDRGTPA